MTTRPCFYLLDAANILFRAYYAIGPMSNKEGTPTGALFGFIRTVLKLLETLKPDYIACVFDGHNNKKQRQEIYEHYKAHRKKMPEDLIVQLEQAIEFCKLKGLCVYNIEGVEADDTIGSIASWAANQGLDVFICSSDKDLCQLVSESIKVVHLHKQNLVVDSDKVLEIYGVAPSQIVDLLALMGDTSDNIPGVEGVGPKTACEWIKTYGSIQGLYGNLDKLPEKKKTLLESSRDVVMMSQKLAQIITDVPFDHALSSFKIAPEHTEALKQLYQSMQFYSLLKGMTSQDLTTPTVQLILTLDELDKVIEKQLAARLHILHPIGELNSVLTRQLVGLCLGTEHEHIAYIPFNQSLKQDEIVSKLQALKHLKWIGHNLKQALHLMNPLGFAPCLEFDTMIASYLIAPNQTNYSLDVLAVEYLGLQTAPHPSGKGKNLKPLNSLESLELASFAAQEVSIIYQLKELFEKKLKEFHLDKVYYDIELPLVPVLARMETWGIYVDQNDLKHLQSKFKTLAQHLEQSIFAQAGQSFNISSPKQLSHILFEVLHIKPLKKTQTGFSTSAEVLEALQDQVPFVKQVLEHRSYEKLRTTYTESLLDQINPHDRRIHCTFNQTVAATGRLSAQDPNLQNIPVKTQEGRLIRSSFKPQLPGYSFLSLDYSQIELRLLAHLSEDPILIEAFRDNQDIHTRTASEVFGVSLDKVTSEMRQKAKAVNFGILYGQQAFGLSQGLDLSFTEAKEFIEKYFKTYKRVKEYLESQKELVRASGYSVTLTGRRRPIADINAKNPMIRQAAERLATNTPLQGTAADLIKMAMIGIDHQLYKQPTPLGLMLLQIHDELLFEVKDESIQELAALAKKEMEGVFKLKVPLIVTISVGKNWGEC